MIIPTRTTISRKTGLVVQPQQKWILILMLGLGCLYLVSVYLQTQIQPPQEQSKQKTTRMQSQSQTSLSSFTPTKVLVSDSEGNISSRDINNTFIPPKTVIMWWGEIIPSGWVECNGQNGTPDLRGRFPLAYNNSTGVSYAGSVGEARGEKDVTLEAKHLPPHTHSYDDSAAQDCRQGAFAPQSGCWMSGPPSTTTRNTDSVGGNVAHNNMPPYFVLKFIMKL